MPSVNRVIILGNLGNEPEVRTTPTGDTITTVSIATSERYKDKQTGEQKENTEWHRVIFFKRLAEIARDYLRKGSPCYIEGLLKTRKWTDKNGVERYSTEIIASSLQLLGSKQESLSGGNAQGGNSYDGDDDDPIPF